MTGMALSSRSSLSLSLSLSQFLEANIHNPSIDTMMLAPLSTVIEELAP